MSFAEDFGYEVRTDSRFLERIISLLRHLKVRHADSQERQELIEDLEMILRLQDPERLNYGPDSSVR